jgi:hypothetical protein
MTTIHIHMSLNHIEEVQDESKEDKTVDIYMDTRSALDIIIIFKDNKNARHIRRIFIFLNQGIHNEWHTLVWIINQSMVADGMAKMLAKKDLLNKIHYMLTSTDI